jgi:hypothetical protein
MRNLLLGAAATLGLAALAPTANAAPTFTIDIGAQTTAPVGTPSPTLLATGSGSASTNSNTTISNWNITASGTGIGLLTQPNLLFGDTITVHAADGAGTLYLFITETGITAPAGTFTFHSGLDNNALSNFSVTENTFLGTGASNVAYGNNVAMGSALVAPNGSIDMFNAETTGSSYTITEEFIIVANGHGDIDGTIDVSGAVPEPASLGLLGVGLLGIGFVTNRKRSG